MGILQQQLISSFGPTRHYEVNGNAYSNTDGTTGSGQAYNNDGYSARLISNVYRTGNSFPVRYKTQIWYKDTLIHDTGYSTDVRVGNYPPVHNTTVRGPKNWPPPTTTYSQYQKNWSHLEDDAETDVYDGSTAKKGAYLFPDIYQEAVKNGETFPNSNTNIENTLQGGSHFLLGDYKTQITTTNWQYYDEDETPPYFNEEPPTTVTYYYEVIKLCSPPPIYRNSIAIEDTSSATGDNDFNDLVVCLKSGDGFFTGTVKQNTTTPVIKEYTYTGGFEEDWTRFTGHSFVANTTGTYVFQVRKNADNTNRLLLHPGSGNASAGNFAKIVPAGNYTHQDRSFTLNAGTYQVAMTTNNSYNLNAMAHVRSIDANYWASLF